MARLRLHRIGQREVYVLSFPGRERKYRVTSTGGDDPMWSPDGRELFFVSGSPGNERMMAVSIRARPELTFGPATALFDLGALRIQLTSPVRAHHIALDGRFLVALVDEPPSPSPVTQFHVVLNWHEELKAKVPPRR